MWSVYLGSESLNRHNYVHKLFSPTVSVCGAKVNWRLRILRSIQEAAEQVAVGDGPPPCICKGPFTDPVAHHTLDSGISFALSHPVHFLFRDATRKCMLWGRMTRRLSVDSERCFSIEFAVWIGDEGREVISGLWVGWGVARLVWRGKESTKIRTRVFWKNRILEHPKIYNSYPQTLII